MPTPSLQEFAQATPVCKQTSTLADVLEIFRSSGCEAIVVVSPQHCPLGVVHLPKLMPHLIWMQQPGESSLAMKGKDFNKPLSQLEPPIIEPLAILPAQMSLSQFWPYLQESGDSLMQDWRGSGEGKQSFSDRERVAVVDSEAIASPSGLGSGDRTPAAEELGGRRLNGRRADVYPWTGRSKPSGERPTVPASHYALTPSPLERATQDRPTPPTPRYTNFPGSYHLQTGLPPHSSSAATPTSHLQAIASRSANTNAIPQSPVTSSYELRSSPRHWALVDEEGKFLGLLNSWLLLESLAPKFTKKESSDLDEQPQPTHLKSLVQLIEHLPLPLSIQTTTGQVLAQNLTWRQQIGISPNLDWVRRTTAAMLDCPSSESCSRQESFTRPDASTTLHSEVGKAPCESLLSVPRMAKERCKTSDQAAIQHFCAIDTPRLATTVSTQQVILSAPSISNNQEPPAVRQASNPALETLNTSQERIFSFVKIPLSSAVFHGENAQAWENESDLAASCYDPSICDLCVVLAQDTTEQQQVTRELAAKNADLIQLNRLKDEFLACISHELKTPLTAVLGLSTLLKDRALGDLNERQARYARLIYQSGRQLMTLVNDILDLTRMETGQLELTCEPVQIQSVCDRAYSQAGQLQQEKDHEEDSAPERTFTLEIEPGLDMLVADDLRLRQMLMHLLSNALKFTDVEGQIGLKVNLWEGWIAFTVWDTGIGIPPEKQHLIFQKFQQLEQPLTRRFEGTGLGLVLTQRLARLHGGDISFISKPDEGSQFTLLLPPCPPQVRRTDAEIPQCSIPNPPSPTRNRLVLIVETVPCYLESLTEQLNSLGYRIVIARSGMEAIEKARGLQPRAILLNPLLPQLSGWDVLTLLKSDAQTRHIPVFVTATQAEKQQAYENKADGFLSLPVQKQALLQSLNGLEEPEPPSSSKGLTILHLSPVEICPQTSVHAQTDPDSSILSSGLTDILNLQHSELNYRILEADDLDQAELLARVWQPDVVLLDAAQIADPLAYLKELSLHPELISTPLVTLDHQTTEAANQIPGLSVYPCLAPDNASKMTALVQVIQVATGMSRMPSIVVMDIKDWGLTEAEENPQSKISSPQDARSKNLSFASSQSQGSDRDALLQNADGTQTGHDAVDGTLPLGLLPHHRSDQPTPVRHNRGMRGAGSQGKQSKNTTSLSPQSSWLQALMQYLQTAGFRSVLSCSWTEIYHQLQEQSVDLLLIRIKNISDSSALVNGLISLTQLQKLPPILVLDHRFNADSPAVGMRFPSSMDEVVTGGVDSKPNLDSLLAAVATQVLRGHSLSMTQLLDQINQALGM
ncbi:ATP-binding protein [Allocoleopsis sp.]|uniref:ATP-binding protein n=1 Tax=Allocoleopsis sp. TaxID=3088169 RepID=UPI002FD565F5